MVIFKHDGCAKTGKEPCLMATHATRAQRQQILRRLRRRQKAGCQSRFTVEVFPRSALLRFGGDNKTDAPVLVQVLAGDRPEVLTAATAALVEIAGTMLDNEAAIERKQKEVEAVKEALMDGFLTVQRVQREAQEEQQRKFEKQARKAIKREMGLVTAPDEYLGGVDSRPTRKRRARKARK